MVNKKHDVSIQDTKLVAIATKPEKFNKFYGTLSQLGIFYLWFHKFLQEDFCV